MTRVHCVNSNTCWFFCENVSMYNMCACSIKKNKKPTLLMLPLLKLLHSSANSGRMYVHCTITYPPFPRNHLLDFMSLESEIFFQRSKRKFLYLIGSVKRQPNQTIGARTDRSDINLWAFRKLFVIDVTLLCCKITHSTSRDWLSQYQ